MPDTTVVHLLRPGGVRNPRGVLYGRLPGYPLSPEGEHMAKAAAAFLAGRDVTLLLSSPLERALETAAPVAAQFGLEVRVDVRLIEPWNHFEGERFDVGFPALRRPANWPRLANPFRPSWGEPYASIAARMLSVMDDAAEEARGHEAVCVSHQLPIWGAPPGGRGAPAVAPPGPPRVRPWQRDQLHLHRRQDHRRQLRRTVRRRTRRGPRRLTPVEPRTGLSVGAPGQPRTEIREVVSGLLWVPDSPGFTGQSGIRHSGARHYRL